MQCTAPECSVNYTGNWLINADHCQPHWMKAQKLLNIVDLQPKPGYKAVLRCFHLEESIVQCDQLLASPFKSWSTGPLTWWFPPSLEGIFPLKNMWRWFSWPHYCAMVRQPPVPYLHFSARKRIPAPYSHLWGASNRPISQSVIHKFYFWTWFLTF